ncbi:MAG: DUF362 domain-containing protein [Clostridia bacterium]|nr:DUF362 domain-containing protein [Clostridia bacterium]
MEKVYLYKAADYQEQTMQKLMKDVFAPYGGAKAFLKGKKRVLIKPNLVTKKGIESGATTHPKMLRALCTTLLEAGAEISVAESHGGTYTDSSLRSQFAACGVTEALSDLNVKLCTKAESVTVDTPHGLITKNFEIIKPIAEAELIINLCKVKTHALTMYSGAAKNTFGAVPGLRKFELHARFPQINDFVRMLNDLHVALPICLNIADGIVGMEGNGPTAGITRNFGFVAVSTDAFMCDSVCATLLGLNDVPQLLDAKARALCPESVGYECTNLSEAEFEGFKIRDLVLPDSHPKGKISLITRMQNMCGGRVIKFFKPRPKIDRKKCVRCGKCAEYCPVKTIEMKGGKPKIHRDKCILCFCCQELCPPKAVYIKTNRILKI